MTIYRTKSPILQGVGNGPTGKVNVLIPAGTRCIPAGNGQFFVDDLEWLRREMPHSITLHDATHYGIRLDPKDVETA